MPDRLPGAASMGTYRRTNTMASDKLRRQIVHEAARLMYQRQESEYHRAKMKAARKIVNGWVKPSDLPSDREIRDEILRFSSIYETAPETEGQIDRFILYRTLLIPLSRIKLNIETHPEGDALYHSLQVFELARDEYPYDEEFLLAALLHDVGKGLDPLEHVTAGLSALGDAITERTAWFIENHVYAHSMLEGTIGVRARKRLQRSDDFDALLALGRCDRDGRVPGFQVPELDEALDYIRELSRTNG